MSRETDTAPGGKLYEAAVQQGADLARKVRESDGPLHFDATEAETLRVLMYGLQQSLSTCQQTNYAIAAALSPEAPADRDPWMNDERRSH